MVLSFQLLLEDEKKLFLSEQSSRISTCIHASYILRCSHVTIVFLFDIQV